MVITGGRLGDMYGARRLFLIGLVGFIATSLACGFAPTGTALILARLAQGLTAALMVPQVLATIHSLFPDAARSRAFAIFGIALGLGGAVGFIVGGWLVTLNLARTRLAHDLLCQRTDRRAAGARGAVADAAADDSTSPRGSILSACSSLFAGLTLLVGPLVFGREFGWPQWLFVVDGSRVRAARRLPAPGAPDRATRRLTAHRAGIAGGSRLCTRAHRDAAVSSSATSRSISWSRCSCRPPWDCRRSMRAW